jgi:hypothetical protein
MSAWLIRASQVEPLTARWLWQDRIPLSALTDLSGGPAQAKSSLLRDIVARLTTARPMPGCTEAAPPADVILLQAEENPASTVVPALRAAGADLARVHLFDHVQAGCRLPIFPDDIGMVEAAVAEHRARLVILDPVASYTKGSPQNEQSVRRTLMPFVQLAEKYDIAVVMVRHLRKSGGRDPMHLGAGAIAFVAVARVALLAGSDPASEDPYRHVLTVSKSNLGSAPSVAYRTLRCPDGAITVEWLGEVETTAKEIALATGSAAEASALHEAGYVLYSLLCCGPLPANEVAHRAAKAGVASRTLHRAKAALGVKSIKRGNGAGSQWLWRLPDADRTYRGFKEHDLDRLVDQLCNGPSEMEIPGSFTDFPDSRKPPAGGRDDEQFV